MPACRHVRFGRALTATALGALACSGPERTTAPTIDLPIDLAAQITDGSGGGEPHFFWLPPIAPATTYPGTFDGAVNPELRLCRLAGQVCETAIATYTSSSSPAIVVSAASQSYSLDWSTRPASITAGDYRAEVWAAGRRLGLADARVVANAKDLKAVPVGFVGVQKGKSLAFTFRLEAGIAASISVTPQQPTIEIGATQQLTATVLDVHGAVIDGAPVIWASSSPAVATVSSTGLVTGVAPGSVDITATSEGTSGSAVVAVTEAALYRVEVAPQFVSLSVGQTATFTATAYDASNNPLPGRPMTWETGDTAVITVAPDGEATAVGPGFMYLSATSGGAGDSAMVEVTGATVTCLRPWALPGLWFISDPYGRAVRARYGMPEQFGTVPPGTISGNYYPVALGETGASTYVDNIVECSPATVTLGAPNPLAFGNLVGPTITALDSLFNLDLGATWDSTANGGLGAIVNSNAPPGAESPRVVQVGLYDDRDHSPGSSSVRFRRTAWVFVDTYSRTTNYDANEVIGDIVFRFLRFGP